MSSELGYAITIAVCVGVTALVLWGMRRGWRRREQRTDVGALPPLPTEQDEAGTTLSVAGVYVSSTAAGDWLDRVVASDLGTRSPVEVEVRTDGVWLHRTGARDVFVPAANLRGVTRAPGIAGKVVGGEGLVVLTWTPAPGPQEVLLDTGVRTRRRTDRAALTDAVAALVPTPQQEGPQAA